MFRPPERGADHAVYMLIHRETLRVGRRTSNRGTLGATRSNAGDKWLGSGPPPCRRATAFASGHFRTLPGRVFGCRQSSPKMQNNLRVTTARLSRYFRNARSARRSMGAANRTTCVVLNYRASTIFHCTGCLIMDHRKDGLVPEYSFTFIFKRRLRTRPARKKRTSHSPEGAFEGQEVKPLIIKSAVLFLR